MTLSKIAKRMIFVIVLSIPVIILAGFALSFLYKAAFLPIAIGAFFGAAISVMNVAMIDRAVNKVINMAPEAAGKYVRIQHFLRITLTGGLFLVAAIVPIVNTYSAAAGVLSFQAATMSMKNTQ